MSARYDQCDSTCTTDCGHCKGAGKPAEFRKGQKVRVTYEAEYVGPGGAGHWLGAGGFKCSVPNDATIEPIEDLRPGDVYRTNDGLLAVHVPTDALGRDDMPWCLLTESGRDYMWTPDSYVERPLTLLVRDGKPVTS